MTSYETVKYSYSTKLTLAKLPYLLIWNHVETSAYTVIEEGAELDRDLLHKDFSANERSKRFENASFKLDSYSLRKVTEDSLLVTIWDTPPNTAFSGLFGRAATRVLKVLKGQSITNRLNMLRRTVSWKYRLRCWFVVQPQNAKNLDWEQMKSDIMIAFDNQPDCENRSSKIQTSVCNSLWVIDELDSTEATFQSVFLLATLLREMALGEPLGIEYAEAVIDLSQDEEEEEKSPLSIFKDSNMREAPNSWNPGQLTVF